LAAEEAAPSPTLTLQYPAKELSRGSTIAGRFEVIEKLGRGGMGTVYRVLDKKINEEIALKLLKPEITAEAKAVERFKNELKLARKIIHKNICRMYDINEAEGILFITMECVAGEDLKSHIRRSGRLSEEKAVFIAKQIGEGLAEAHRLGVVHRDLKPQNIMLDKEDGVHIMDFGIARLLGGPELTEAGMIIGTPDYMSPEQVEGRPADGRSDIYSLGVILYEMVTGRVPFTGETSLSVAVKHKTETPADPRQFNSRMLPSLSRMILKCLEKNPVARYQKIEELQAELENIRKEISGEKMAPVDQMPEPKAAEHRGEAKSIAVLSFKDLSPQHDQEYFCEGLAEDLINALTQVKDLRVAARTSSFSFKGKEIDIREIGKSLNVGSVLEGSVQKAGNRLRITAQLISVVDGYHLWSERFDRDMKDIFAVQDEISMAIVEKLKVELGTGEKEKVTKKHTQNKDAYNLYLKGRYFWNRRYKGDMIKAVSYYHRAISKDPRYALPYVGVADVFNIFGMWAYIHPKDAYTKSRAMLQKALEIDSELSEAYSSLGFTAFSHDCDFEAAEKYMKRAIELNPANMYAHGWFGIQLGLVKRPKEALLEAGRAAELDPLFSLVKAMEGMVTAISGEMEKGRQLMNKAIEMDPAQPMPYLFLGMFYIQPPSVPEKAIELLEKAAGFGLVFALGWLGLAYAMIGKKEEALGILTRLEKLETERYLPAVKKIFIYLKPSLKLFRSFKKKYVAPMLKGLIYYGLNRQEEALEEFEKSLEAKDYFLPGIFATNLPELPWKKDFVLHPRYMAIRKKLKIE
jgi:serine/threonine protein kinase